MRFLSLLAAIIILATSCAPQETGGSDEIIPRDQFVDVMLDIQLLETAYLKLYNDIPEVDSLMNTRYAGVLQKHDLELEEFERSFNYYMKDEDVINDIYDEVISKIKLKADQIKRDTI